jgi:hypothetical protein
LTVLMEGNDSETFRVLSLYQYRSKTGLNPCMVATLYLTNIKNQKLQ